MEDYIIRTHYSNRASMRLKIEKDGSISVHVPTGTTEQQVRDFVARHSRWIRNNRPKVLAQARAEQASASIPKLTPAEMQELSQRAKAVFAQRAAYYAPKVGVTYNRITCRYQRSRWGSCSAKGNLNFNCLLLLAPPEVLDSVVVHELCHRKEMNHSGRFYAEVLRVCPNYYREQAWLKEHGAFLMARLPEK